MYKSYSGLVIDIETLSANKISGKGAVITEIGAVPFYYNKNQIVKGEVFFVKIDTPSQIAAGLEVDPDTVNWHLKQGHNPTELLNQSGPNLTEATDMFLQWTRKNLSDHAIVYAWGSDFDVPMLHKAYVGFSGDTNTSESLFPWKYHNYRCARSVFFELTCNQLKAGNKIHTADADALVELEDLVRAWNYNRKPEEQYTIT